MNSPHHPSVAPYQTTPHVAATRSSLTELNETIELLTVGMDSVETDVDTMVGAITLTVEAKTNTTSSTMAAALAAAQATASGRLAGVTASISGVLLLDRCSHRTVQSPIL